MAKAAADAQAGRSPAQRAGAASSPGDTSTNPSTGELDSAAAVADAEHANAVLAAEQAGVTDPSTIAATVPRGSGAIPYEIDGQRVSRQQYADHVAAAEREQAKADLDAATKSGEK